MTDTEEAAVSGTAVSCIFLWDEKNSTFRYQFYDIIN